MNDLKFLKTFLKNPRNVGAVIPSSKFLAERLVRHINFENARCIVEFGSGSGAVTDKIIKKMPKDCKLFCFETDNGFIKELRIKFNDPRVFIIEDSAEYFGKYLKKYGYKNADYIISGLPIAILPKLSVNNILEQIKKYLSDGGKYAQFQYSLNDLKILKKNFSNVSLSFEIINIPPAFVYICSHRNKPS